MPSLDEESLPAYSTSPLLKLQPADGPFVFSIISLQPLQIAGFVAVIEDNDLKTCTASRLATTSVLPTAWTTSLHYQHRSFIHFTEVPVDPPPVPFRQH